MFRNYSYDYAVLSVLTICSRCSVQHSMVVTAILLITTFLGNPTLHLTAKAESHGVAYSRIIEYCVSPSLRHILYCRLASLVLDYTCDAAGNVSFAFFNLVELPLSRGTTLKVYLLAHSEEVTAQSLIFACISMSSIFCF